MQHKDAHQKQSSSPLHLVCNGYQRSFGADVYAFNHHANEIMYRIMFNLRAYLRTNLTQEISHKKSPLKSGKSKQQLFIKIEYHLMLKLSKVLLIFIIPTVLTACAGWEVGSKVAVTPSVSITSRTYDANIEVVKYANGTSVTNIATSAPVTWADDHITKTITYTFADGTTNPVVSVVPGISSIVYSTISETMFTTYGDGYTSSTTNTARTSLKSLPTQ